MPEPEVERAVTLEKLPSSCGGWEVAALQKEIAAKERWETRTTVRKDLVNAMDKGGTVLNTDEEMELGGAQGGTAVDQSQIMTSERRGSVLFITVIGGIRGNTRQ